MHSFNLRLAVSYANPYVDKARFACSVICFARQKQISVKWQIIVETCIKVNVTQAVDHCGDRRQCPDAAGRKD